ncbi:S1 family peptidase [Actinosynnema sp. NPDC050436]|uniref:S1 family peptidase n=1 Tax=Actinosynnema sp. NPDC050436 TaxID=3155659 RepID=UPI0034043C70
MNRTLAARITGVVLLAAGTVAAAGMPATAEPTTTEAKTATPAMFAALQRDLGLSAEQATDRLAREAAATGLETRLRTLVGADFAGSWFDGTTGKLVVGTTDAADLAAIRAAGADARKLANSAITLDNVKAQLDKLEGVAPKSVTGWYVDPSANQVVVTVNKSLEDAATTAFTARASALGKGTVRVDEVTESPRTLAYIRGGDAYYMNGGGRCSIGFAVQGGFVSAGHCGTRGTSATNSRGERLGQFYGSSFPGNDYAVIQAYSGVTLYPYVNDYRGGNVVLKGSQEAPVGASVCRSGSTTGWHCGTIQAKNQTVRYQEGAVYGTTRTSACAEPGDSGGSWVTGQQAQGVTSGGSGDCSSGGTTYFQPVNEILNAYGLRLLTG